MTTETLTQFAANLLEDGTIDPDEVGQIRTRLMADGIIDREEANFLFLVNERATTTCSEFDTFFVEAISSHLLEDDQSPGEVDTAEASWLREQIENDGEVDANETALLRNLRTKVTGSIPEDLQALFNVNL
ncbi:MAG: TerB family tellurite resistance protein [Nitrososphaerales archaeon]